LLTALALLLGCAGACDARAQSKPAITVIVTTCSPDDQFSLAVSNMARADAEKSLREFAEGSCKAGYDETGEVIDNAKNTVTLSFRCRPVATQTVVAQNQTTSSCGMPR